MTGQELAVSLKAGKPVYGTMIKGMLNQRWARGFAELVKLDFVFIDNEHFPLSRESTAEVAISYHRVGVAPLIRIPVANEAYASMAMDATAHGVIAPYIETAEQARAVVGAVKYRPLKGAQLRRILAGEAKLEGPQKEYVDRANTDAIVVCMIESLPGLDNLGEIAAVKGIDVLLVGTKDLSVWLGVPDQYESPVFEDAVMRIVDAAKANNIAAGIHFGTVDLALKWKRRGCNFILHESDVSLLVAALRRDMEAIREENEAEEK